MTPTTHPATPRPGQPGADHAATGPGGPAYVLWKDFKPREGGVLDLIGDMSAHLVENRLRIVWVPGVVTEYPLAGGEPRSFEFAFRNSIFRLVMARMGVLCGEKAKEDPIYPYRGRGEFTDPRWPHVRFRVEFTNTPADQRLDLTPIFPPEPT